MLPDPAQILIVDDDVADRAALSRQLSAAGYRVRAIAAPRESDYEVGGQVPDLVLLSGLELLRHFRRRWNPEELPIILIGAVADSAAMVAAFEAGANDYALKPIDIPVLIARIATRLRMKSLVDSSRRASDLARANEALAAEVAERRRVEEALRRSEERFEKAFRASPDGVTLSHRDSGKIIDANDSFGRMFGFARDEVINKSSLELDIIPHPPDRDTAIAQLRATGMIRDFERPARRRGGEIFPVSITAEAIEIGGEPCMLTIVRDMTERERARQARRTAHDELERRVVERTADLQRANDALRESEERFRMLADGAPMLLWVDGVDGACQFLNKSWLEFTGRKLEEEVGYGWVQSVHPDDRRRCLEGFRSARQQRERYEVEYRLRRHDGEYRWILDTSLPRISASGEFMGYIGACLDITDLRSASESLRESEERFRMMADYAPVLLWMTGADGLCSFVNRSWCDFTGRPIAEELGTGWTARLHPEDRDCCLTQWRQAFDAQLDFTLDYRIRRADGQYRWLFGTGQPRFTPDGSFAGYIGSCVDVTERREAEQVLRETAAELDHRVKERTAELAKSNALLKEEVAERGIINQRLIANQEKLRALASQLALAEEQERRRIARGLHDEIGQSLAMMKIRLGSFDAVAADPQRAKDLEEVRAAVDKAIGHIRSLTFELGSRILFEFGLETALEDLTEQMQRHGLRAGFSDDRGPKPLDEEVRVILYQAARELLHNVIKHARAGAVSVSVSRDEGFVRVEVTDDGIGFDPRTLSSDLPRGGGFGLFNIRERLDYVGGRIEIQSAPERGTRSVMYVPVQRDFAADGQAAPAPRPRAQPIAR